MRRTFLIVSAVLSLIVLGALVWGWLTEDGPSSAQVGVALVAMTVLDLT
ncbi:hypothetical protein [Roseibium sp. Sym1]|nr:hypothetical protein [Roseibium sp. Sym1]